MKKHNSLPDKITVKHAADFLILTYGSATPKLVRNKLIKNGFSLNQLTVSALLELIAREQGWDYRMSNTDETYYSLPKPPNESTWFQFSLN